MQPLHTGPFGPPGDLDDMSRIMIASIKPLALSLTLVLVLAATAAAQRADITYRNSRGDEKLDKNADIKGWTYKSIQFKGKTSRDIAIDDLISVEFRKQPAIFEEAVGAMKDGALRSALAGFEEAIAGNNIEGKALRKSELWCQEHAHFHAWVISRRLGRIKEADGFRDALMKAYPKSAYIPEIALREANDLFAFGDFAKAVAAYDSLVEQANKRGYAQKYKIWSGIGKVRSLLGAGQTAEAANAQGAVAAAAQNEESRLLSEIAKGDVMVAQKKIGQAESLFKNIFNKVKGDYEKMPAVFAGAANGLGDCFYASSKFNEAMFEYSKTFALFAGRDGLDHENGWAYWRFANSCKQVAAKLEGEESKVYAYRFRKNRDLVSADYRFSRGGQLARREKGMGK